MAKINYLDNNIKLEGKRVLIRTDFNVPLNNGYITEASRIEKVLPTIKFLINSKAKIIIIYTCMWLLTAHLPAQRELSVSISPRTDLLPYINFQCNC